MNNGVDGQGRVAVKFVIGATGAVTMAATRRWRRWSLVAGSLALAACARAPGAAPAHPAPASPTSAPAQATEPQYPARVTSCGAHVVGGGTPVDFERVLPELGRSPAQCARRMAGSHTLAFRMQRWWLADDATPVETGTLTLVIETSNVARLQADALELDVHVRLEDPKGAWQVSVPAIAIVRGTADPYLNVQFESPELAHAFGAPPSFTLAAETDTIELTAEFSAGGVSGGVYSQRGGMSCELLRFPVVARKPCDAYTGLFGMADADAAMRLVGVDDALVPGFTPMHAIRALRAHAPLYVHWPDAPSSRLALSVEPLGFACVAEGDVPTAVARQGGPFEPGFKVVTPVAFSLRTSDARLDARLAGFIETYVSRAAGWDGALQAVGAMTPVAEIASAGGRAGFLDTPGKMAFLGLSVEQPVGVGVPSQITRQAFAPYPGVPSFPLVSEVASNRASCFGAQLGDSREARLSPEP